MRQPAPQCTPAHGASASRPNGRSTLARAATLTIVVLVTATTACGRSSADAVRASPIASSAAVSTETVPTPVTAPTTTAPTTTAAAAPSGTRDSFAIWLVDQPTPGEQGRCVAPAVGVWQDPSSCYLPDEQAVRLGPDSIASSSAKRMAGSGEWYVELVFTPEGLDRFNELTVQALSGSHQIAYELGGSVISAPTVLDRSFDNPSPLYGQFGEHGAATIAAILSGR